MPIIKLKFNLSEYYDSCVKAGYNNLPYVNFDSIDSINPHLKELSVDISICDSFGDSEHLGLLQSNFVREKLEEYPILRPVCLMLKKLLVRNELNDPYTGGLGSYSLFIMLYAALYFEMVNSNDIFSCSEHTSSSQEDYARKKVQLDSPFKARLFAWFLSFYGECFNIETHTMMFLEGDKPIVLPKLYRGKDEVSNKIL